MERKAVSQRASRPFSVPQLSMKQASASLVIAQLSTTRERERWRLYEMMVQVREPEAVAALRFTSNSQARTHSTWP